MTVRDLFASLRQRLGWTRSRTYQPKRRQRQEGLNASVATAEERILLSGVTAADDSLVVEHQDATVEIDVLANDSGSGLNIISASAGSGTVTILDGGSGSPDQLQFTPAAGFTGTDTVTYTVEDSTGNQSTGTASIEVTGTGGSPTVNEGELPGTESFTTGSGFVPSEDGSFVITASGNYSLNISDSTTSVTTLDLGGINHDVTTVTTTSLFITSSEAADGSWTYIETYVLTSGVTTNPSSGVDGETSTSSESYSYTLNANGDSSSTSYTFTITTSEIETGSSSGGTTETDEFGNVLSAASGTGTWTFNRSSTSTITNDTDLTTGVSTGSRTENGSETFSYFVSGTYSYATEGGTVSGTYSEGSGYTIGFNYGSGSGTSTETGYYDFTYNGSGSYSLPVAGGSLSGTITEGGSDHISYGRTTNSVKTANGWTTTGSGSGSMFGNSYFSLIASGSYGYSGSGYSVSGTVSQWHSENTSYQTSWGESLGTDGEWALTSASGFRHADGNGGNSYTGSGTYTSGSGGSLTTATITETGNWGWTYGYTTQLGLGSNGSLIEVSGSGTGSLYGMDDWTFAGSSSFSVPGGAGTSTFSYNEGYSFNYGWEQSLNSSGQWEYTDSHGTDTAYGSADTAYSASGTISISSSGSGGASGSSSGGTSTTSLSGTFSQSGNSGYSYQYTVESEIQSGAWQVVSGNGTDSVWNNSTETSNISGTFGSSGGGTSISGTITGSHGAGTTSQFTMDLALGSDGAWELTSGSGTSGAWLIDSMNYNGSGTYSTDVGVGTINGTISFGGGETTNYNISTSAQVVGGAWQYSGSASVFYSINDNYSTSGSGSYSYAIEGGSVSGTMSEYSNNGGSFTYSRDSQLQSDGTWVDTDGSINLTSNAGAGFSFSGAGSFTQASSGSSFTGTIIEGGGGGYTDNVSVDLKLNSDGEWELDSANNSSTDFGNSDFSMIGIGTYSYAVEGGTVSGATMASISNGGGYSYTASSAYSGGAWVHSGSGSYSSYDTSNFNYAGGGTTTVPLDGGSFTGTISESGSQGHSVNVYVESVLNSDGEWDNTFGTINTTVNGDSSYTFTGTGSFSDATSSGTVTVTSSDSSFYVVMSLLELQADDTWELTNGTGTYMANSMYSMVYNASGSFSFPVAGGMVSGSFTDGASEMSSSTTNITSTVVVGEWVSSGTVSNTSTSSQNSSYNGSGTYSYSTGMGAGSGTGTGMGTASGTAASGTAGSGTAGSGTAASGTAGSGTAPSSPGTVSGTITVSGGVNNTSSINTLSTLNLDGSWTHTGGGGGSVNEWDDLTYAGSGTYTYNVNGGSVSGTMTESGSRGGSFTGSWSLNLGSAGWEFTSANFTDTTYDIGNFDYAGSGSYNRSFGGGSMSGTITEGGGQGYAHTYSTTTTLQTNGTLRTSGSGTDLETSYKDFSYAGSGT